MKLPKVLLAGALACATSVIAQDVHTDFDHHANFEQYHTFCINRVQASDQLVERRMRDAIISDLTRRGLQASNGGNCDLTIAAIGQVRERQQYTTFYNDFDPGWGWGRWGGWGGYWGGWGGGPAITNVQEIPVGTLVIDAYDSRSRNLVFRGTAKDDLSHKPEKNTHKLYKAVDKIFDKFPVIGKRG